MSDLLPPFGIRGLLSPSKPFAILQISTQKYDSTVAGFPEAALTWPEDDDGETITVGSGGELQDRLEEQVPSGAPVVSFYNVETEQRESQPVHIFDISRSSASLSTWSEHEAYWSKTQRPLRQLCETIIVDNPAAASSSAPRPEPIITSDSTESGALVSKEAQLLTFSDALPDLLGGLATLLKGTADVLQIAATKTRQAETTPVEDILSGMTTILGEASACGLELFKTLDRSFSPKVVEPDTARSSTTSPSAEPVLKASEDKVASTIVDLQQFSFTDRGDFEMASSVLDPTPIIEKRSEKISAVESHTTTEASHSQSSQPAAATFVSPSTFLKPSKFYVPAPQSSLLDQDAEDADFTARYPPLATLRRAKNIGGMYATAKDSSLSGDRGPSGFNRPSPQVFDAETQRRKEFSKVCFPTQEYTPGLGAVNSVIYPKIVQHSSADTKRKAGSVKQQENVLANDGLRSSTKNRTSGTSGTENQVGSHDDLVRSSSSREGCDERPLPGGWPGSEIGSDSASHKPASESTGAFFKRMFNEHEAERKKMRQKVAEAKSSFHSTADDRLQNVRSRVGQGAENVNPAARLSYLFNSIPQPYNVQPPMKLAPEQGINSMPKRVRTHPRDTSNRRPRSLYEPYRAFVNHRSFSPVWEDHLQQAESSVPNTQKEASTAHRSFSPEWEDHLNHSKTGPPRMRKEFDAPSILQQNLGFRRQTENHLHRMRSMPSFTTSARPSLPQLNTTSFPAPVPDPCMIPPTGIPDDSDFESYDTAAVRSLAQQLRDCEQQLRDMGFGGNSPDLLARLHVYAAAANGSVSEAVDMIDGDQQAHKDAEKMQKEEEIMRALKESFGPFAR